MLIAYIIVGAVLLIFGFISMLFYFDEQADVETFVDGLRIVSIFTAASWTVAFLWPVLLVSLVPVLIVYGLWRIGVEAKKALDERKVDVQDLD